MVRRAPGGPFLPKIEYRREPAGRVSKATQVIIVYELDKPSEDDVGTFT